MKITPINIEAVEVSQVTGLDAIDVFWSDRGAGRGCVVITCWGCAWTAYFNAMGEDMTIRQFFKMADANYLINKLGITPILKQRRADHDYLGKIIVAIKGYLAAE